MNVEGPSGFLNAPVTKFLVPLVGGCSALAYIIKAGSGMSLQVSQLTVTGQLWRIFSSPWTFNSVGTTVIGTWLIYKLRIIERRYGSAKYAAFIFISFVLSTLLQAGVSVTVGSRIGFRSIASGPYAILFSILYQFHKMIPPSYQVKMLGTTMSDKTYTYFAATQLLLTNSTSSMIPCICGLTVGVLYDRINTLKQWRFPKWIRRLTWRYILPVLNTNSKRRPREERIKEEDINTILGMFPNYSRENIKDALIKSKSDLNRAVELLLLTAKEVDE
ncbi:uncharacterized protein BX663DRAFT_549670 [Cokeromyces recurvatus]|uniref:uncharacterized protein n=1 Tax=Cokeromyces recurvatus TaxID=90255 RepID=UPI00221EED72|nr:uncharacterized protein BX663DRAFT_549670 [Cokeromyces recurvatus]KAI7905703.1 hypothetical protein BX663DRAFT_549670 [Cokeromyces recurvatus]